MMNANRSMSGLLSRPTSTKHCNSCKLSKPLTEFHRKTDARDGRQGRCKHCHKLRQRDWVNSDAPSRQKVGEIELTAAQQRDMYEDVIYRMVNTGIMSRETARESLRRVNGL